MIMRKNKLVNKKGFRMAVKNKLLISGINGNLATDIIKFCYTMKIKTTIILWLYSIFISNEYMPKQKKS